MKLLIDIGNTSAKLAVWDAGRQVHFERLSCTWAEAFSRLESEFAITSCCISTVAADDAALHEAVANAKWHTVWLAYDTPCCINAVPEGYGADRLAADIGARAIYPEGTLLVIDAGTCITYDLIDSSNRIIGGVISPGIQLRLKAMHEHTALLPYFEAEPEAPLMGNDTKSCMMSSAVNGVQFEIEGYIRRVRNEYHDLHVCITGGNSFVMPDDLADITSHDPYLVLRGLDTLCE